MTIMGDINNNYEYKLVTGEIVCCQLWQKSMHWFDLSALLSVVFQTPVQMGFLIYLLSQSGMSGVYRNKKPVPERLQTAMPKGSYGHGMFQADQLSCFSELGSRNKVRELLQSKCLFT